MQEYVLRGHWRATAANGAVRLPGPLLRSMGHRGVGMTVYVTNDAEEPRHVSAYLSPPQEAYSAADLNASGRLSVGRAYLEAAGIERDVTIVGMSDHIELWNTQLLSDYLKHLPPVEDILARAGI